MQTTYNLTTTNKITFKNIIFSNLLTHFLYADIKAKGFLLY